MRFMCLVYIDREKIAGMTPADGVALTDGTIEFDNWVKQSGKLILAQPLERPETAVTVRLRDGKLSSTDGPFAETKEHMGGLFFIEARDRDEAIEIAGKSPILKYGSIEVRPVPTEPQRHSKTGVPRPTIGS